MWRIVFCNFVENYLRVWRLIHMGDGRQGVKGPARKVKTDFQPKITPPRADCAVDRLVPPHSFLNPCSLPFVSSSSSTKPVIACVRYVLQSPGASARFLWILSQGGSVLSVESSVAICCCQLVVWKFLSDIMVSLRFCTFSFVKAEAEVKIKIYKDLIATYFQFHDEPHESCWGQKNLWTEVGGEPSATASPFPFWHL